LEVVHPWLEENLPVRDVQWFKQNASSFDRISYHLGNNPVHKHMFALLESHPGVVVMHDLYLGNAIEFLDSSGYMPGEFVRALYATAGWSALLDHKKTGAAESSWKYPCSKPVLDLSHGVIVHSASSCQLADHLYGTGYSQNWQQLPVLRGNVSSLTRKAACDSLGLDDADFLVCSFGMVGLTKLNDKLLQAWLDSDLAQNPQCKLVFVGDVDLSPYGRSLVQSIEHFKSASRIEITGFVSPERYKAYLAACDCAVQLRTLTRGESSASLLDCLLHGIPTITNAHGANAEIPDGIAIKLKDQFEIADLSAALARLHRDGKLRGDLRKASKEYVEQHHAPLRIGTLYHEAIEKCMALSRHQSYQKLLTSLASIASDPGPVPEEILAAANAIGANQIKPLPRQFLVDISALVQKDLKTGIQRVVRSILNALLTEPPHGFRVMPVYSRGTGDGYRYAAQFMRESFGLLSPELDDAPIEADSGDVFLGLDLFTHGTFVNRLRLQELKNLGIQVYFVVYDILPLLRPECFPEDASSDFRDWLETVATVSNGLICISRAVSNELHHWLTSNPVQRLRPLNIGFFHLGADIDASAPTIGLPTDASEMLSRVAARQSFLAVGTVEPRKGHAQTLSAMELLWEKGIDVNYVIVGSHGWLVDEMAVRISNHPEWGIRLFWLQGASDEMLARVYIASTVLLAASEGEGFGLPLIEAARQGLPVLARNLPVFREVMGASASYFDASSPHELAEALERWLNLSVAGNAPQSHALEWLTWSQSAKQLVGALQNASWNHTVPTML
jgi:glycosyltransferase involved in cell wall biosynthesis